MRKNTNQILNDVFVDDNALTAKQDSNAIINAVHDEEAQAIRVNVTNLSSGTETSVKDDAFKVNVDVAIFIFVTC